MQGKFGINLFYRDPLASLEMAKSFGYTYIDYGSCFNFHAMPENVLNKIKEKTRELDLIPFSLHNPYCLLPAPEEKDDKRKIRQLREVVDTAAFLGVKILTVHPGVADKVDIDIESLISYWNDTGFEKINEKSIELLAELCEYAETRGIMLTFENLPLFTGKTGKSNFYSTIDELLNIIRYLHSLKLMNIGICFDTGHANIGGINVTQGILKAGIHLKQLHLNDNPGEIKPCAEGDLHLICGEGNIEWKNVVDALKEIAYEGPITFEFGSRSRHPAEYIFENATRNWICLSEKN